MGSLTTTKRIRPSRRRHDSEQHLPTNAVQTPTKPRTKQQESRMITVQTPTKPGTKQQESRTPIKGSKTSTSPTHWAGGAYMNSPAPKSLPMPDFDDDDSDSDDSSAQPPLAVSTTESRTALLHVHKSSSEPSTPSISRSTSPLSSSSSPSSPAEGAMLQFQPYPFAGYVQPVPPMPFHLTTPQYSYYSHISYPVSPPHISLPTLMRI